MTWRKGNFEVFSNRAWRLPKKLIKLKIFIDGILAYVSFTPNKQFTLLTQFIQVNLDKVYLVKNVPNFCQLDTFKFPFLFTSKQKSNFLESKNYTPPSQQTCWREGSKNKENLVMSFMDEPLDNVLMKLVS